MYMYVYKYIYIYDRDLFFSGILLEKKNKQMPLICLGVRKDIGSHFLVVGKAPNAF